MSRGPDCRVCTHPQRAEIERMLRDGQTQVRTAEAFGLQLMAVHRHIADGHAERDGRLNVDHVPAGGTAQVEPTTSGEPRPAQRRGISPVDVVGHVQAFAARVMRDETSAPTRLKAAELLLKTADLMVRAAAVAQASGDRSETERREQALRSALLRALAPFPDAHGAVLAALDELDADPVAALVEGQE